MAGSSPSEGTPVGTPAPSAPYARELEEEAWTDAMGRIVERDFFPDLRGLAVKHAWLAAANAASAAGAGAHETGERAAAAAAAAAAARDDDDDDEDEDARVGESPAHVETDGLSLDEFTARYTSEDNAAFGAILASENATRQRRAEARGLYTGAGAAPLALTATSVPRLEAPPGQQARVALPPLPPARRKGVNLGATRMVGYGRSALSASTSGATTPTMGGGGATPRVDSGGATGATDAPPYAMLAAPSPRPGDGGESPFMTWGRLGSTPMRVADDGDAPTPAIAAGGLGGGPGGHTGGPAFGMPPASRRDEVGRRLDARHKALKRSGGGGGGTPRSRGATPAGAGRRTPSGGLSPALQSLASRLGRSKQATGGLGGGSYHRAMGGADMQLRASYGGGTPRVGNTPKGGGRGWTPTPRRGGDGDATPR